MYVIPDGVEATTDPRSWEATEVAFPQGFLWGGGTASFQVEGSTTADGRKDSIWDVFCRIPGKVTNGDTGDPGADHYRRMADDVRLMSELGLGSYRFSLAWPRVRPDGGVVNEAGLEFYERLIDTLLDNEITPCATLYHWDLPQALEDIGGWTNRDTAYRFAEYAEAVLARLGDRVPYWSTLNEPWCSAFLGYASGVHAPGRTEPRAAVAAIHHLLLAHGLGMDLIRRHAPAASAGITLNLYPTQAVDPTDPADVDAARRVDGLQNRVFLEPVLSGAYPDDILEDLAPFGLEDHIVAGDLAVISAPIDLLGVNYYRDYYVSGKPAADGTRDLNWIGAEHVSFPRRDLPRTDMDWDVYPEGLTEQLVSLHERKPDLPLYVTENGAAYADQVDGNGRIDDVDRVSFLDGHLRAVHAAIERGADVRGYFVWSLLDNLEWAWGYGKRFGIVHVDFETQVRTPKLSAYWYARVIANNGLPPAGGR